MLEDKAIASREFGKVTVVTQPLKADMERCGTSVVCGRFVIVGDLLIIGEFESENSPNEPIRPSVYRRNAGSFEAIQPQ